MTNVSKSMFEAASRESNPLGTSMPGDDIPGWRQIFSDDFATDASEGEFWNNPAYKWKWKAYDDGASDTTGNGVYCPSAVVSATGGMLVLSLRTGDCIDKNNEIIVAGVPLVAALLPQLSSDHRAKDVKLGKRGGLTYGRYTIRFKADLVPGYKTAWLLWPDDEDAHASLKYGEIDFPEGNLTGKISAFMHPCNARSYKEQDPHPTNADYADWHIATIEWVKDRVTFILDGKECGTSTNRIPYTPMHWVIQTETATDDTRPSSNDAGRVYIDWVAVYTPD